MPEPGGAPGSRRVRVLALLLPVLAAGAAFLSWSQEWVVVTLLDGRVLTAAGDAAAPAVPPFALAALALVGALALAGVVFRIILGVLQALLGFGIAVSGVLAIADPIAAAAPRLTEATGVEGAGSLPSLIESVAVTGWAGLAVAAGIAAIVIGIGISLTASRWPQRTRRYDAARFASAGAADASGHADRLDAWDALSDGDDPTAR